MFVFLLLPELSLARMFVKSETFCDFSSLSASSMSQSTNSLHRMTPLQEFRVLCEVTVTGRSIMCLSLVIALI